MYEGHVMGFGGGFMWIFWILLIVAIVWGVKAAAGGGGNNPSQKRKSALDILKERYARGEIDQQEYEQKRKDLQQ
jgi:putative membrane protein